MDSESNQFLYKCLFRPKWVSLEELGLTPGTLKSERGPGRSREGSSESNYEKMGRGHEKLELVGRKEDKMTENELIHIKYEQCLAYRKCSTPERNR